MLARFSVDCDDPNATDASRVPRGFSFRLGGDGQHSDIFTQSAPVHFAGTLEQMLGLLGAHGIAAHPQPPSLLPSSLAGTTYWAVHAFPATNAKGETRFIKFKVMPVAEQGKPSGDEAMPKPSDLLQRDLDSRIAARDVRFSVMALLDRPGDPVMDVTIRWPGEEAREALRLGTIVITGVETENACDEAAFNPANLADGIGHPPDEMFAARCAAYAISQTRRR
ncbi:catalase [Bradyrhizobium guangdongense]|uniref:catalase n=1 Tax=Bradyrhizobium guangdongense TaxID=1325090 RepID=UPI001FEF61F6|nr:catalase [Bradyrhizobium guangdongense]